MRFLLLLVLSLSLLTGCSALTGIDEDYPRSWPAVLADQNLCHKITGTYANHGRSSYSPDYGAEYLVHRFGLDLHTTDPLGSVRAVTIQCHADQSLKVTAESDDKVLATKQIKLGQGGWRIEQGALYFPPVKTSGGDGTGGYTSSSEFRISISETGTLIGEQRKGSAGLVLWLIPIGAVQTFWFEWPQA